MVGVPGLRGVAGWRRLARFALVLGGCYQALAAGMNNVANAVGPVTLTAGIDPAWLQAMGGAALGIGAALFGGRVLETNARKLTQLNLTGGLVVALAGGTLVIGASLLGYPVPLTQVTTMGILGYGLARGGVAAINGQTVRRVVRTWVLSPVAAAVMSYGLVTLLLGHDVRPGQGAAVIGSLALAAVALLLVLERLGQLSGRVGAASGAAGGSAKSQLTPNPE